MEKDADLIEVKDIDKDVSQISLFLFIKNFLNMRDKADKSIFNDLFYRFKFLVKLLKEYFSDFYLTSDNYFCTFFFFLFLVLARVYHHSNDVLNSFIGIEMFSLSLYLIYVSITVIYYFKCYYSDVSLGDVKNERVLETKAFLKSFNINLSKSITTQKVQILDFVNWFESFLKRQSDERLGLSYISDSHYLLNSIYVKDNLLGRLDLIRKMALTRPEDKDLQRMLKDVSFIFICFMDTHYKNSAAVCENSDFAKSVQDIMASLRPKTHLNSKFKEEEYDKLVAGSIERLLKQASN